MVQLVKGICQLLVLFGIVFLAGCAGKNQTTAPPQNSPSSMQGDSPMADLPMMKEDPMSIKSVQGVIREVGKNSLVVFTTKHVTLKFARDAKTQMVPAKAVLVPGTHVKIDIDHLAVGMRAQRVTVLPAPPMTP